MSIGSTLCLTGSSGAHALAAGCSAGGRAPLIRWRTSSATPRSGIPALPRREVHRLPPALEHPAQRLRPEDREAEATQVTSATERTSPNSPGREWPPPLHPRQGRDENFRVYAVNIDGSNPKELTPSRRSGRVRRQAGGQRRRGPHFMNRRDSRLFDVYRINVNTGEMAMIAENPGNISGG